MAEGFVADTFRREYTKKLWVKIACVVAGLGGPLILAVILMQISFLELSLVAKAVVALVFLVDAGIILAFGFRSRVVIEGARISVTGILKTASADLAEIEGCRKVRSRSGMTPKLYLKGGKRTILLPTDLNIDDYFRGWIDQIPEVKPK